MSASRLWFTTGQRFTISSILLVIVTTRSSLQSNYLQTTNKHIYIICLLFISSHISSNYLLRRSSPGANAQNLRVALDATFLADFVPLLLFKQNFTLYQNLIWYWWILVTLVKFAWSWVELILKMWSRVICVTLLMGWELDMCWLKSSCRS